MNLHIIVCYAPTFRAQRCEKDRFFTELQRVIQSISPSDKFVVLGDFNARVGSGGGEEDLWSGVLGPHGYGQRNDAGMELLTFLALHETTICNTWFQKPDMYKQTCAAPGNKAVACH